MNQPEFILKNGTRIRTHDKLGSERGMMIDFEHLLARIESRDGTIAGVVPGHGGDVYWVDHNGTGPDNWAPYCYTEFEPAGET